MIAVLVSVAHAQDSFLYNGQLQEDSFHPWEKKKIVLAKDDPANFHED
jgi:hypothetical protein